MKFLVVGESCLDVFVYCSCTRMCPDAPVPVVNPKRTIRNPGMAMNVVNNLRALKHDVSVITNDNWETLTKTRYIDDRINHMFLRVDDDAGRYRKIQRKQFDGVDFESYDAVVISDYNKGFLTNDDIKNVASKSTKSCFLDSKRLLTEDVCRAMTYVKINESEYEKSIAANDLTHVEDKLIVTLGSAGARWWGQTFKVENVKIKDTAGAGDTFLAGLASNYVETGSINSAIEFANACATKVVQKRGVCTI